MQLSEKGYETQLFTEHTTFFYKTCKFSHLHAFFQCDTVNFLRGGFHCDFMFGQPVFFWHNVDFKLLPDKHTKTNIWHGHVTVHFRDQHFAS
jgi:hypothetical protein